jgi:isoquinoline 1-oxidoreductase subunit beta
VIDAAAVSKVVGKLVNVVWSREEDMRHGFYRAATSQRIVAGLDDQDRLAAWSHKIVCSSILKYLNPAGVKQGIDMYSLGGLVDCPNSPYRNRTVYGIAVGARLRRLPMTPERVLAAIRER